MGRKRTLNRMDYRSETDEEYNDEEPSDDSEDDEEDDDGEEEEEKPAPKKKAKAKKKTTTTRTRRTRATKTPRQKVVWGVFDNANKRIKTFDYSQKAEADQHAAKMQEDKGQIYFVQPVKEQIEEPKE